MLNLTTKRELIYMNQSSHGYATLSRARTDEMLYMGTAKIEWVTQLCDVGVGTEAHGKVAHGVL